MEELRRLEGIGKGMAEAVARGEIRFSEGKKTNGPVSSALQPIIRNEKRVKLLGLQRKGEG